MASEKYDVIVEGAGPAGSTFARLAAERGFKVALCDPSFGNPPRLETSREKPCGGFVDESVIKKYKIPERAISTSGKEYQIIDTYLEGFIFISPYNEVLEVKYPQPRDVIVRRSNFDFYNLENALFNENVRFFPAKLINAKETNKEIIAFLNNNQKIKSEYIVGAGGVFSKVREDLFWQFEDKHVNLVLLNSLYFSEEDVKERFKDMAYVYFPREISIGYAFAFPGLDYVRVGVGQEKKKLAANLLAKHYKNFLEHPLLRKKLKNPKDSSKLRYSFVPFAKSKRFYDSHPSCGQKKVLLGDAAYHVCNTTFEGIRFAMQDAEFACNCLDKDNSFINFDKTWKNYYGDEIIFPRSLIKKFYDKVNLSSLFHYAKEFKRGGLLVSAFKGRFELSYPEYIYDERVSYEWLVATESKIRHSK